MVLPTSVPVSTDLRIRPPRLARVYVAVFGVAWCGGVGFGFVDALVHRSAAAVIPAVMLAFGVTLTSRLLLIGAITEDDSLIVRNHFVTRRLARSDIEEFRIGRVANQPINETIHILLRDRRILTIEAAVWPRFTRRGKQRLAQWQADLEMWLTHSDGDNAGLTESRGASHDDGTPRNARG